MAEEYNEYAYFYNSTGGDRKYNADSLSDWLSPFFCEGVFNGQMQVTANDDMTVTVAAGNAWIGCATNQTKKLKHFTESQTFTLETASGTLDRVDTVVVRRDDTNRDVTCAIVTGGYAASPVPTDLQRSGAIYEIELAKIYVAAGAVKIEQADITDMRADTSVCGWVAATVKEISLEQITAQFNDFFQSYNARISKLFAAYAAVIEDYENKGNIAYQNLLSAFSEFETGQESEFNTWFEKMKGQLSEDAAGNLQNQITALDSKIGNAIQDLSTKLVFSNLSKETGTIGITVTNTTTGTATKFDYSEGGKTYLTEPGEYTVSADSDSLMILPKKFTLDNAKTTETLTFKISSRNAYAYVGGYVGAYVNKSN